MNAALFVVALLLVRALALDVFGDESFALATMGMSGVLLYDPFTRVLSEPLFIVLALAFLWLLRRWVGDLTLPRLVVLTTLAALACLQRYVGVTLIITGVMAIILYTPRNWMQRAASIIVFSWGSLSFVALWMMRNVYVTGNPTGGRPAAVHSLPQHLALSATSLTILIVPLLILTSFAIWRKVQPQHGGVLLIFALVYIGWLNVQAVRVAFDPINYRLLVPAFVPLLIAGIVVIRRITADTSQYR